MAETTTAHGYPTLTDPNIAIDPVAARLLVNDQHALGVALSGDILLVAVDAVPTPARFAELESATGMALTVALTSPELLAHLRSRALAQPAGQPGVVLAGVLRDAVEAAASDVLLHTGRRPAVRAAGQFTALPGYPHLSASDVAAAGEWFTRQARRQTVTASGARWRAETSTSGGRPVLSLRRLPAGPVRAEELHLPAALAAAASARNGLIVIASPHGGGRTTSAAGVVDLINTSRPVHIVTVARPVEYVHQPRQAVVTSLEVGTDAPSAADAVLAAGRLGADVIEVDVRLADDARAAISAAVSGHLVICVVPATSSESALRHLTSLLPPDERTWALEAVASTLRVATAQQLLPTTSGALGAVFETLCVTEPVRAAIRGGNLGALSAMLENGTSDTSSSMDRALALNVAAGRVHLGTARQAARDTETLDQYLAHTVTATGATSLRPTAQPALTPAQPGRAQAVAPSTQRAAAPAPAPAAAAAATTGRRAAPAPAPTAPAVPVPSSAEPPRRATLRRS